MTAVRLVNGIKRIALSATMLSAACCIVSATEPSDTAVDHRNWVRQLYDTGFRINDPSIRYPRFARFCLNVYNWGDRTFNSYDPDYVVGTGKNWKLFAKDDLWSESYSFFLPHRQRVHILSSPYNELGASIQFMAVSLGMTFNTNKLMHREGAYNSRMNVGFTCSMFNVEFTHTYTKGGGRVLRLGDYSFDGLRGEHIDNMSQRSTEVRGLYFFNHNKFAWAAAYCYSKYQLRSQGSWFLGGQYLRNKIDIDFLSLPDNEIKELPAGIPPLFSYKSSDWCVMGGYSYNWVLKPRRWLINVTAAPSIGYKSYYSNGVDGKNRFVSTNIAAQMGVVYNHRSLFCALTLKGRGYFYFANGYTFFNSTESATATVGMRF